MEATSPVFKPWRTDYKEGAILLLASLITGGVGFGVLREHWTADDATSLSLIIGGTLVLACFAFWQIAVGAFKRGYYRMRGAKVEKGAIAQLVALLPAEWKAVANTMALSGEGKAVGDVDLVINTGADSIAIEIKSATTSWGCDSYWRRLTGIGIDPRADLAIDQAKRNAAGISSATIAIVWLPMAKRFRGQYRGIAIVGGDAKYFRKSLP